jgi:hypothetical protein
MAARDIFALIIRAVGVYSIYKALDGAAYLLGVASGFDMHLKNAATGDAFYYLCQLILGLAAIAWADRLAGAVYRGPGAVRLDVASDRARP